MFWSSKRWEMNGVDSRPQGVSSDSDPTADQIWRLAQATPGKAPCPLRGQREHRGLLAQDQLRRNMDPGKHAAKARPSSSCRWLWSSQSPLGSSLPVQHPKSAESWEPPVPAESHKTIPQPGLNTAGCFPHRAKGQKSPCRSKARTWSVNSGCP